MLFKTRSAAVYGIEAYLVDVEVNLTTGGNGQTVIVGLPDTAVRESKNRVLPAIRNNGYGAPYQKIVINLGPADVKKEGSAFDLPMAIGILGGFGLLAKQDVSDYLMVGELSLDGKLRPVKGVLSIAMLARDRKIPHLLVPLGNAREAGVVEGVAVYPVRTLTEVVEFCAGAGHDHNAPLRNALGPRLPIEVTHFLDSRFVGNRQIVDDAVLLKSQFAGLQRRHHVDVKRVVFGSHVAARHAVAAEMAGRARLRSDA